MRGYLLSYGGRSSMVEHWVVVPVVAGSNPVAHPILQQRKVNFIIMKNIFYTASTLSLLSIIIGFIRFNNFRDRLYLAAMFLMFLAIVSGILYLIKQK